MIGKDRQAWIAEYDRLCDLINKLVAAKNNGDRDTKPTFNALVVTMYEHLREAGEEFDSDCRHEVRLMLDEYLADKTKAA